MATRLARKGPSGQDSPRRRFLSGNPRTQAQTACLKLPKPPRRFFQKIPHRAATGRQDRLPIHFRPSVHRLKTQRHANRQTPAASMRSREHPAAPARPHDGANRFGEGGKRRKLPRGPAVSAKRSRRGFHGKFAARRPAGEGFPRRAKRAYCSISSIWKHSMTSPSLMSL